MGLGLGKKGPELGARVGPGFGSKAIGVGLGLGVRAWAWGPNGAHHDTSDER